MKTRPDHFFKYVTVERAKQIITDKTLRWSAPSQFNDPFDVQFDLHVEYDRMKLIDDAVAELWAFYNGERGFVPANALGIIVKKYSMLPKKFTRDYFQKIMRDGIERSLAMQEEILPQLHATLREQLSPVQIFCLSETPSSILMWSHYAKNHTGVVLRLSYVEALASPWGAAKPVQYRENMPMLFDHKDLFMFLTGQAAIDQKRVFEESVTVKAIDWKYEQEWRVIYHGDKPAEFDDTPFDISQLTGIYFGCLTSDDDRQTISELARKANPKVEFFRGRKSERKFSIYFER